MHFMVVTSAWKCYSNAIELDERRIEVYKMNEFIIWSLVLAGVWNVSTALMMKTQNMKSSLFFKVIPMFCGAAALFAAGKLSGQF